MSLGILYIWKVKGFLLWGRQLLKRGLVWKIDSGNSIPLSASNWIHGISSPTILHPIDPSLSFVSFFINSDNTWIVPRLKHYLPLYQISKILQIPLHYNPAPADTLIWGFHHSPFANANIHSSSSSNPNPFEKWWKTLWTLPIPPKIKHFSWKAFNRILSCALNLFHKKVLPQPSCSSCSTNIESVSHALIDCTRARHIWKHSKFKNFHNDHRSYDIKDYYLQALQLISKEDLPHFGLAVFLRLALIALLIQQKSSSQEPPPPSSQRPKLFTMASLGSQRLMALGRITRPFQALFLRPGTPSPTSPGFSFLPLPRQLNTSAHSLAKQAIRMREDDHDDST
ncbi:hypothetical protein G4B88_005548 [Cannabis sativa]|uniref:Reverse transcriptase zinc-binding domain-containing protein n=1 Tax=Cannabis sativa TaxID=3483 RepID=A0A7J6DYQ0_CANSA|nr:hypothetical protein G4B88_005548 [Cannabis sativa]